MIAAKNRSEAYNFILQKIPKISSPLTKQILFPMQVEWSSLFQCLPQFLCTTCLISFFSKKGHCSDNAIIRTFWWTGISLEPASKPSRRAAWKNMCTPKSEGGLGIQNL
jgi:hypothetical protein